MIVERLFIFEHRLDFYSQVGCTIRFFRMINYDYKVESFFASNNTFLCHPPFIFPIANFTWASWQLLRMQTFRTYFYPSLFISLIHYKKDYSFWEIFYLRLIFIITTFAIFWKVTLSHRNTNSMPTHMPKFLLFGSFQICNMQICFMVYYFIFYEK